MQVREPSPNYRVLVSSDHVDLCVSATYWHIITVHHRKSLGVCCEPSVRVKDRSILAKDIRVSMSYPAVDADDGLSIISYAAPFLCHQTYAFREELPTDLRAAVGHNSLKR